MTDPYAPPRALDDVDDAGPAGEDRDFPISFYTTSISTLVLLQIITFGAFSIYWFYRHWDVQRRACGMRVSPLGRGLFSIFYVHQLFRVIDRGARRSGLSPAWSPGSQATTYLGLVLAARIIGRLTSDEEAGILVDFCLVVASVFPLATAQRVANLANGRSAREEPQDEEADAEDDQDEDDQDEDDQDEDDQDEDEDEEDQDEDEADDEEEEADDEEDEVGR